MFTALKNIIPRALEKNKLSAPLENIKKKERVKEIVESVIGGEVEVIRCRSDLMLRVGHPAIANEIRMKEKEIRGRLKEEGIFVDTIRCA